MTEMVRVPETENEKGLRKTFVFPEAAVRRLEGIKWTCRLDSYSQVLRLALMVLEELVLAIRRGDTIVIRDKSGQERIYDPIYEPEDGGNSTAMAAQSLAPHAGRRVKAA